MRAFIPSRLLRCSFPGMISLLLTACSGQGSPGLVPPAGEPTSPQNRADAATAQFAYVANSGANTVSGYSIESTGALKQIKGSPFAAGSGAFAVAIDASGKYAYVADSGTTTVSGFAINASSGGLTALKGSPFGDDGYYPEAVAADPKGEFIYTANYGTGNVSGFAIGSGGALKAVPGSPFAAGTDPDSIGVDPDGKFLFAGNYGSSNFYEYAIDSKTGALSPVSGSPYGFSSPVTGTTVAPRVFILNTLSFWRRMSSSPM